MRSTSSIGICFCASLISGVLATRAEAAVTILPPGATVDGRTIGEYTADSWRATAAVPASDDAVVGGSGNVLFVNGGNSGVPASRTFTVPEGKYLLFPLLTGELSQLEIGFDKSAAQVRQ